MHVRQGSRVVVPMKAGERYDIEVCYIREAGEDSAQVCSWGGVVVRGVNSTDGGVTVVWHQEMHPRCCRGRYGREVGRLNEFSCWKGPGAMKAYTACAVRGGEESSKLGCTVCMSAKQRLVSW
eukprot:IDg5536t1